MLAPNPYTYPEGEGDPGNLSSCCPAFPFGRKIGNLTVLIERRRPGSSPKFLMVVGPCWPMLLITIGLILGVSGLILSNSLPKLSVFWWLLAVCSSLNLLASLLFTACSDPGKFNRIPPHRNLPATPNMFDYNSFESQ